MFPPFRVCRHVVVTDMDETLISKKSTSYIVKFLVAYRAFIRLVFCLPPAMLILVPLSKIKRWFDGRTLAVRIMYFLAFRGLSVQRALKVAAETLPQDYVGDLQDPATSAVLAADAAVILTASPTFMARPWLGKYLGVSAVNVLGAELEERDGRFTGRTGDLPIGQKKVELLEGVAGSMPGCKMTGYGDHETDVPFLRECSRGVLVHQLPDDVAQGCDFEPARRLDKVQIGALIEDANAK